jgi:hypothetical protein
MATGKPPAETPDDRILVEFFCEQPDCRETEDLLSAVANSVRWSDRVEVRVQHLDDAPDHLSPRMRTGRSTVIVCGRHRLHDADYSSLKRALEDCEEFGPE